MPAWNACVRCRVFHANSAKSLLIFYPILLCFPGICATLPLSCFYSGCGLPFSRCFCFYSLIRSTGPRFDVLPKPCHVFLVLCLSFLELFKAPCRDLFCDLCFCLSHRRISPLACPTAFI